MIEYKNVIYLQLNYDLKYNQLIKSLGSNNDILGKHYSINKTDL